MIVKFVVMVQALCYLWLSTGDDFVPAPGHLLVFGEVFLVVITVDGRGCGICFQWVEAKVTANA